LEEAIDLSRDRQILDANLYFFSLVFQVVKELLVKETGVSSDLLGSDVEWCREEELPEETRCKVCNKDLALCLVCGMLSILKGLLIFLKGM
jgi:hypothetical protein